MIKLIAAVALSLPGLLIAQTVSSAPSQFVEPSHVDSRAILAQLMQQKEKELPLLSYDVVNIRVVGAKTLSVKARIEPDGGIEFPFSGRLFIAGLTISQAQTTIQNQIAAKHLVLDPSVIIELVESPQRMIQVTGKVRVPGLYSAWGNRTLGDILALAGGPTNEASNTITLIRPGIASPISIPLSADSNNQPYAELPLFAGDEIRVPAIGNAYVIGAVKKQGAIPLKNFSPTTVVAAVAMSEGIGYEAAADDARLVRTQGNQRVLINVPLRKILKGKSPDIALQNDDILYIPTNTTKAAIKGGGAGLIVSLASLYVYAQR